MTVDSTLADIKRQVAIANRILAASGLSTGITAALGHASMRVPDAPDRFVVKGRGYRLDALSAMRPEDMVVCDTEGNFLDGPPGSTQCFEVKMHSCIYRQEPTVQSVVHVHPRFTVLLTTLGITPKPMCQEGHDVVRKPLPLYPHTKTVVTEEEGTEVANLARGVPAVLLKGHGATTVGSSLEQAVMRMLLLEEQARMNYYAFSAMGRDYPSLPEALLEEIDARPPMAELPHLKEPFARIHGQPPVGGVWQLYTAQVSHDL
jgi:ribulose-5-phosphate 4-epimerase/fuculose-1-phosphate aldolase